MIQLAWSTEALTETVSGDQVFEGQEHLLEFDAVPQLTAAFSAVVTEHPVERGAPLSDHKIPNLERLTLQGVVTNAPITSPPPSGFGPLQGPQGQRDKTGVGATALVFTESFDRISDVLSSLRRLVQEPIIVTVTTPDRVYESMTVVSVSVPQDTPDDSRTVLVDLMQYNEVDVSLVDAPEPREPRGQRAQDSGSQETEEEEEATEDSGAGQSALARAADAGVSAFREGGYGAAMPAFLGGLVGL